MREIIANADLYQRCLFGVRRSGNQRQKYTKIFNLVTQNNKNHTNSDEKFIILLSYAQI